MQIIVVSHRLTNARSLTLSMPQLLFAAGLVVALSSMLALAALYFSLRYANDLKPIPAIGARESCTPFNPSRVHSPQNTGRADNRCATGTENEVGTWQLQSSVCSRSQMRQPSGVRRNLSR